MTYRLCHSSRHSGQTWSEVKKAKSVELGRRVRQLRLLKGWTQEYVADQADLHVTYLASIEAGNRNPSLLSLVAIARGLDLTLSEMLEGL